MSDDVLHLIPRLAPLLIYILMGFIAGRVIKIPKEAIAKLLIYILAPVVFFTAIIEEAISISSLTLPFVVAFICSLICLIVYKGASVFFKSPELNLLSFASGSANTGYFGIPATIILLGEEYLGTAVLAIFGYNLYEYSVGFYVAARGNYSVQESIKRVSKLPALYAFILAIFLNLLQIEAPSLLLATKGPLQGAYSFLGLSMIGFGISRIRIQDFDFKFIGTTLFNKFVIWPALMASVLLLDKLYFQFYSPKEHLILTLMSIVPVAANGVSIAAELKMNSEKIALSILISTFLAIFYVPIFAALFMGLS